MVKRKLTVTNIKTGKTRVITEPSIGSLRKVLTDGVDRCVGPCGCTVEPDGSCPQGWQSRSLAAGLM